MQQMIFIADLIACSTCFGHHYAHHHQELESIIQVVAACRVWCLVFKLSVWCGAEGCVSGLRAAAANMTGSNHLYNTLELLMMSIMVPEACWASNKICNKNSSVASSWHFISTYFHIHFWLKCNGVTQIQSANRKNSTWSIIPCWKHLIKSTH